MDANRTRRLQVLSLQTLRLLAIALLAWSFTRQTALAKPPNVLFLFADDQRADAIGALGHPVVRTPHLDRLVERGFVFENTYCMGSMSGAVCNPSRHMMLSGRSLFRYDLQQIEGTFGEVMRRAGYVTWHLSKRGNTARAYHTAFEHTGYLNDNKERTSGHHGRTAADRAIQFLTSDWKRDRPFFLYLGFAGPHDPRVADEQWMSLYERARLPLPVNYLPYHPFDNGELLVRDERLAPWPRTTDVVREHLHEYYACISSIDHHIGRIINALAEQGVLDETLIVFSADHGLAVGSHGLFGKQSLYEHSMKSPLVFAGPGIPHGQSDAFAYLYDIFPTVADLVGASTPDDLDGRSLAPVMRRETDGVRDAVFLAYKDVQRAVRRGDWKLIRYPKVNVTQLFDLHEDPHEQINLAELPQYEAKVAELWTLLEDQQRHFDDKVALVVPNPLPPLIDAKTIRERAAP